MFFLNTKKSKYSFKRIEVHIVNHCNLNCKGCAHFSNVSIPYYLSLKDFKKEFKEINKKINYELINILGGEPLLHPNISNFFYEIRKISKNIIITLNTNGILLPSMNEEFWESLRKNQVHIRLSLYPKTDSNLNKIKKLLMSKNIPPISLWDGHKFYLRKTKNYNENENEVWKNCDCKICHQLHKGKLYVCPTAAYGQYYNEYFKTNFYLEDGIDIYKNNADKINEYLTNKSPNCKTCTNNGRLIDWELSKSEYDEWDV